MAVVQTGEESSLRSEKQVTDGRDEVKSLNLDLQQKEKRICDLHDQLSESGAETGRLQREIASLSEEIRKLQQQLCDLKEERDQALSNLANKEEVIEQLMTEQASNASLREHFRDSCQALLTKEKLIEEMRLALTDKERIQSEQEQLLEARLNEIESLSEELVELKEKWQKERVTGFDDLRQEEQKGEQTAGLPTTDEKLERSLRGMVLSPEVAQGPAEKADPVTGQLVQLEMDSSVLSTESEREEKRFPKPQLEISFTPLKPNRVNVRRPGDNESVTVKIRRTARKRKSAAMECYNSVQSENRKNLRVRGNPRANIQSVESPPVLSQKANQLKQQDSPINLKGRKDGTLRKIGDFIQSSPTLLGSKAKKIMAIVAANSPESQITSETNNKPKRSKRKLFKTHISSPLDIPAHPIIGVDQEDKESDDCIIKRRLRARVAKR